FSRASQTDRQGQLAATQRRSSSTRHKVRPPNFTGAGTRFAAWSRHQLASDRPHIRPPTSAGISRASTVEGAGAGVSCCTVGVSWSFRGGLAGTVHLLPGAGAAIAHSDTQAGQVSLRLGSGLVVAFLDGFFQLGEPVEGP